MNEADGDELIVPFTGDREASRHIQPRSFGSLRSRRISKVLFSRIIEILQGTA